MDLDRTLFDTDKFVKVIWDFAERYYGIDAAAERGKAPDYFTYHNEMYDYRFFDHLRAATGKKYNKEQFVSAAKTGLPGGYLYGDVTTAVIDLIDAIITFGNQEYQMLKLALCPGLKNIDSHYLLEPKGPYIARTFKQPSILIDDKRLEGEILAPCTFVRIDRSGARPETGVITSLRQVPALLEGVIID